MVSNKQVIFTQIPTGLPDAKENMEVRESEFDLEAELASGEIVLKTLEISVDPYMRGRMRDAEIESYIAAFPLGEVMTGDSVCVVVKSNNPDYKVDDIVYGITGFGRFEEYYKLSATEAKEGFLVREHAREDMDKIPLSYYVGALGMPGMAAHYGLHKIGQPKKGETIYISSASGAVGQLVGQYAKAIGLTVVGSASSKEKVDYLKNELNFDAAFNYREGDILDNLKDTCPNGIDIYFDCVGGKMLDAALAHANNFSRVVVCGMISQYNGIQSEPLHNAVYILTKRMRVEGYIIMDHQADYDEVFMKEVTSLFKDSESKIKYSVSSVDHIDSVPEALVGLFSGNNFGKQVVHVADL